MRNQYLVNYKSNYYLIQKFNLSLKNESQSFQNEEKNICLAKMNLCKYALENNIEHDISNESFANVLGIYKNIILPEETSNK